jgi:hypothetical protein
MHLGGHGILGVQPTYQDLPPQVPPYYQQPQQWNSPNWKNWSPQYASHHPWLQGWRGGNTQGNTQAPPVPMPTHPYPQFPPNIQQFFQVLFPHLYLLFQNNPNNTRIQAPQDQHYYQHNRCLTQITNQLNLFTMLSCKPSRHMLFLLFHF